MTSFRLVCPECKSITVACQHEKIVVGSKWRAPSKHNDNAWKRIMAGEIWWDRKAIDKKAVKDRSRWNNRMYRGKEAVLEELEQRLQAAQTRKAEALKEIALGPPKCDHEWCLWSYKRAAILASNREAYEGCPRGPMETT